MDVKVNKDVCIGCGLCASIASAVFAIGDDGLADNVIGNVPADFEGDVNEAKDSCPVQAIEVK